MKRVLSIFAVTMLLAFGVAPQQVNAQTSGDEQHAIAIARAALTDCLAGAEANLEVSANANFNNGTWNVTFFGGPRCLPGQICPLFIILLATAELDENFQVISAQCGTRTLE